MTTVSAPPQTQTWNIDETHTNAQFSVRHLMISTVRGRFANITGSVVFDPRTPAAVDVRVTIPVASVETHNEQRDTHLKSADFFDAANHPQITFVGKRIKGDVNGEFQLIGDLTVRGTTREFVLNVTSEGSTVDPWGNDRRGFNATGKLNRNEFGLTWNAALETGGVVVGDDVKLNIDVELVLSKV